MEKNLRPCGFLPLLPVILVLMSGCLGLSAPETSPEGGSGNENVRQTPEGREDRPEEGLKGLPPEARAYLNTLSEAFRRQDQAFLLAQGEAQFEREVRPRYDDETYLALLYRIGPLGEESEGRYNVLPRLSPQNIRRIEYSGWNEEGPLLEIRGRLIPAAGGPIPCRIMLIWRLREPRILGLFP